MVTKLQLFTSSAYKKSLNKCCLIFLSWVYIYMDVELYTCSTYCSSIVVAVLVDQCAYLQGRTFSNTDPTPGHSHHKRRSCHLIIQVRSYHWLPFTDSDQIPFIIQVATYHLGEKTDALSFEWKVWLLRQEVIVLFDYSLSLIVAQTAQWEKVTDCYHFLVK